MRRALHYVAAVLLAAVIVGILLRWHEGAWHGGLHAWYKVSGANDEGGPVYGSWSGILGATSAISAPFIAAVFYYHHTCHDHPFCLRWGKYPAAGGMLRYCHKHHPDFAHLAGRRLTREDKHQLHAEWKRAQQR